MDISLFFFEVVTIPHSPVGSSTLIPRKVKYARLQYKGNLKAADEMKTDNILLQSRKIILNLLFGAVESQRFFKAEEESRKRESERGVPADG